MSGWSRLNNSADRPIALIPARGGSKRIPRKNIRDFCGKPLICYSIESALDSNIFSEVIVSTDSETIAEIAQNAGGSVYGLRPPELSSDRATTMDVWKHEARQIEERGQTPRFICNIMATAPFLKPEFLSDSWEVVQAGGWTYVIAAATFPAPVLRAFCRTEGGGTKMLWPEQYQKLSQELPEAWHDAGMFYWGEFDAFKNPRKEFFGPRTTIFPIPRYLAHDLDTLDDWTCAERVFIALQPH